MRLYCLWQTSRHNTDSASGFRPLKTSAGIWGDLYRDGLVTENGQRSLDLSTAAAGADVRRHLLDWMGG